MTPHSKGMAWRDAAKLQETNAELLAALIDTLHELRLYSVDVDDDDLRQTIERASAAITKAQRTP